MARLSKELPPSSFGFRHFSRTSSGLVRNGGWISLKRVFFASSHRFCPPPDSFRTGRTNEAVQDFSVCLTLRKFSSCRRGGFGCRLFRGGTRNPCRHATTGRNSGMCPDHFPHAPGKFGGGATGLGRRKARPLQNLPTGLRGVLLPRRCSKVYLPRGFFPMSTPEGIG